VLRRLVLGIRAGWRDRGSCRSVAPRAVDCATVRPRFGLGRPKPHPERWPPSV